MNTPRPLREVLGGQADRLAEDRHAALAEAGHPDLPDALVAEAVVSFADTAPHQVAEHLAPFVTAHSAVRLGEPAGADADLSHGLHLLATAPTAPSDADDADAADADPDDLDAAGSTGAGPTRDPLDDLDFGGGAAADEDRPLDEPSTSAAEPYLPAGEDVDGEHLPVVPDGPFVDTFREYLVDGTGAADGDADPDGL
jgi:hypothetical protein